MPCGLSRSGRSLSAAVSQGPLRKQEHSEVRVVPVWASCFHAQLSRGKQHWLAFSLMPCCPSAFAIDHPLTHRHDHPQMASALKEPVKPGVEEAAPVHRIRITLSSRNVKNLEKGTLPTPPLPPLPFQACL